MVILLVWLTFVTWNRHLMTHKGAGIYTQPPVWLTFVTWNRHLMTQRGRADVQAEVRFGQVDESGRKEGKKEGRKASRKAATK